MLNNSMKTSTIILLLQITKYNESKILFAFTVFCPTQDQSFNPANFATIIHCWHWNTLLYTKIFKYEIYK